MSSVELEGVTVYVSAIESVTDGVSREYDRLWDKVVAKSMALAWQAYDIKSLDAVIEEQENLVFPERKDYPAVVVKLTSGREFRIVGKTRKEVEEEILWAKRRDRT